MTRLRGTILRALLCILVFCPGYVVAGGGHDHGGAHDHHEAERTKGPHRGRLLTEGDFALEVTIFETDVPPQFRVYPFLSDKPLSAAEVSVTIKLTRFGDKVSEFKLLPESDYLTSSQVVEEPHSFDVQVIAVYKGRDYTWSYESHEGRTELSEEGLRIAQLTIATAGPQVMAHEAKVYGILTPNQDHVIHVKARFSGVLKDVRFELGDQVKKGDILAVVESNQSLQPFELRSPLAGEVIARHAAAGEFVAESDEIMVIADLSDVWADFQVYRDDFEQIEKGQRIMVELGQAKELSALVRYVSPLTDESTQSKLVRAVLPNADGRLRPGLFVSGTLASAHTTIPLAVERSAIQTFRDWKVVYVTDGHVFQAMPVELGRQDRRYVEVLSGIEAGQRYVAQNSFIIKADVEKSGATHDH